MIDTAYEQARMDKLNYVSQTQNPYPERFIKNYEIKDIADLPDGTGSVRSAGRIMFIRRMGKLCFVIIADISGKIQVAVQKNIVGDQQYEFFKNAFDIGDFIGVEGEVFTTQTNEKTIRAVQIYFLGKALRALPEKFHGVNDVEICYRQRYLDLIMNGDSQKRFILKSEIVKEIRRFLEENDYMEVETPVLINKPSGANAKPFMSHHNALDIDVYLRIAPETYLKRAIVGGFTKVFEFARCFRNEGADAAHLQDFTLLESYCAYFNYKDNMKFTKDMMCRVVTKVFGSSKIQINGKEIDFAGEWPVISFRDLILKDCSIDISQFDTAEKLLSEIRTKGIVLESEGDITLLGRGSLIDLLYKKVSRPRIVGPAFLVEHPVSLSPLARANDDNPQVSDRFQLIINGAEVINGYSELVDPVEQYKRLAEQASFNDLGDDEAMVMDKDYITAMLYGMPPISGWGLGIDRLLQVLTGEKNLKDYILFPLMRPID